MPNPQLQGTRLEANQLEPQDLPNQAWLVEEPELLPEAEPLINQAQEQLINLQVAIHLQAQALFMALDFKLAQASPAVLEQVDLDLVLLTPVQPKNQAAALMELLYKVASRHN